MGFRSEQIHPSIKCIRSIIQKLPINYFRASLTNLVPANSNPMSTQHEDSLAKHIK